MSNLMSSYDQKIVFAPVGTPEAKFVIIIPNISSLYGCNEHIKNGTHVVNV